jgi:CRP-like cAMP-binding protein
MFSASMASAEELTAIPLFESLDGPDLDELGRWFTEKTADEGTLLCGEGATGYSFFILTQGSAVVTADGETLADLGPGDFFGEIAMLTGRRSATVTATSPARLLVMFGQDFRQLEQTQPAIAARIEEALRQRLATRA